jgi:hypothetical protein
MSLAGKFTVNTNEILDSVRIGCDRPHHDVNEYAALTAGSLRSASCLRRESLC